MGACCSKGSGGRCSGSARVYPAPAAGASSAAGASTSCPSASRRQPSLRIAHAAASAAVAADKCVQVDGRELLPGTCGGGGGAPAHWRKGDAIGAGSFGAVHLGLNLDTGAPLV